MKEQEWKDLKYKLQQKLRLELKIEECIRDIAYKVKPVVEEFRKKYKRVDKRFIDRVNQIEGINCRLCDMMSRKVLCIYPSEKYGSLDQYDYIGESFHKNFLTYDFIYERLLKLCEDDNVNHIINKIDKFEKDFADARKLYEDMEKLSNQSNLFKLTSGLIKFSEFMSYK